MTAVQSQFDALKFDNKFVRDLPEDPKSINKRRQVYKSCFSRVRPVECSAPKFVAHAKEVSAMLDLGEDILDKDAFAAVFSGKELLPGMDPFAMCYGGHQFGNWAGQLGDGRAINLGEVVNKAGERWTLQLKGAGPTPYSRMGDGFAVLRSSIREFLCSEAMYHLGVPTTRALSLVETGDPVMRDMFYDGRAKNEPGAVVCRVAPSFVRFGNFQIFGSRNETDELKTLVDYTIKTDFPHLGEPSETVYEEWFSEVCVKTAELVIHWMRVGFVHGVLNTDNMSILGLTIDYGPYGWLDNYDAMWTPNTTDKSNRRYRYGAQPEIALWNLVQLATALSPLVKKGVFESGLEAYGEAFNSGWKTMMAQKLGFKNFDEQTDDHILKELQSILQIVETDMTIFFRKLADFNVFDAEMTKTDQLLAPLLEAYYIETELSGENRNRIANWLRIYKFRGAQDGGTLEERRERMNGINPKYVLRNYLAQEAIELAEKGDYSRIHKLLEIMRKPYDEQSENEDFAKKRPDWARDKPGCSTLSCSS